MKMKTFNKFFIGILILMCFPVSTKAQVIIDVPATNIFNWTELMTVKPILEATGFNRNWRVGGTNATIWSTSGTNFDTTPPTSKSIPTHVLHWQLFDIGGVNPPYMTRDIWPIPFKWFTSSEQSWYEPYNYQGGDKGRGDIRFTFKIPSSKFSQNAFYAGEYAIDVTHNYTPQFLIAIVFTPSALKVILKIPTAMEWLSNTPTKYIEISSLNDYRTTSAYILGDLGAATIGNTIDFNLWAKASSTNISFTSSKNVQGTRNISTMQLGSTNPKLITAPLTATAQKYTSVNFGVEPGNRNNFTLQLSVSPADFKNHFFEAGTYTFQLNLDAKSASGTIPTISKLQNTDVTIKVLPLSEITIPTSKQTVNFNFNTSADYNTEHSEVMLNQIKLSNNETFELYVKSDENYFKKAGVQSDLNSNILQVGVDGSALQVPLSTTPKIIMSNGTPVLDQELNIKYTIPQNAAQSLTGKEKTTYSINVIYSFTAQ